MKHRIQRNRLRRNSSHRRCLIANMLKSLVASGRIVTTVEKAKEIRRHADKLVTLAKTKDRLTAMREVQARLMLRFNPLTSKERRLLKEKHDASVQNTDRQTARILFDTLVPRFADRQGGYTRLIKMGQRRGDAASMCVLEFLQE